MDTHVKRDQHSPALHFSQPANGADIINKAESAGLDARILYESVIDLSAEGLLTANCINLAAGILLKDLGLPRYFFDTIQKQALNQLLQSIATNIRVVDGRIGLYGRVANIDFDLSYGSEAQRVRIATEETRDSMESLLEEMLSGHRREYYFSPENSYYTYIIRAETVQDFTREDFQNSRFLYTLAGDYSVTPEPTRKRYEKFLIKSEQSTTPLIQVFNLPETGETRLMFKSDFESPQLPTLRKILSDSGYTLVRAYWEPYLTDTEIGTSVCSLYIREELTRRDEEALAATLRNYLCFAQNPISKLYLDGVLTFQEMIFGGNAIDFTHLFIFKESENATDKEIIENLENKDHQDAFAKRIQDSNKSTYGDALIEGCVRKNPDLISDLFAIFERRFNPKIKSRLTDEQLEEQWLIFEKKIRSRFIDFSVGYDIFRFMFKIVSCTLKTNFFSEEKRSFSFRFDNRILDPLVFSQFVYGIFFVNGHYACGTHMRAGDIARGGLRLLRVSRSNYDRELDGAVLLNYALGPKAQRIKHKDICESGSKGVVIPHSAYARSSREALFDYTEGIMDLMLLEDSSIVDYYGQPEMIFFGPDEGTAQLMDDISLRARERGYQYWRTITTGKSFGIPHDTYGLLESGECFGLFDRGKEGVELQIDGQATLTTRDMEDIYREIGGKITISGMTTTSIMSAFRTMIDYYDTAEEDLNLMITGGPDGDLGANQIQCYKGNICLIIDGGSVLFDPRGLDKKELQKLAFARNSRPRLNSLCYPPEKLSPEGFMVPLSAVNITLPDGTLVEDGALFHRTFLTAEKTRKFIKAAHIRAFIPCGGFKDTINQSNIHQFLATFKELEFIVEGANVFFDDSARRYIATETTIKQIKDSSANKGGVFSSSIAEVLTALLLGDSYDEQLQNDRQTKWGLIKDIMTLVARYASLETRMIIELHEQGDKTPLFQLSELSSEQIFALQEKLQENIDQIIADDALVERVLKEYIPPVLVSRIGLENIRETLSQLELKPYRDTLLTKKLAAMALYKFGTDWQSFLEKCERNLSDTLQTIVSDNE
jgi:glutamate dehydrogenase